MVEIGRVLDSPYIVYPRTNEIDHIIKLEVGFSSMRIYD